MQPKTCGVLGDYTEPIDTLDRLDRLGSVTVPNEITGTLCQTTKHNRAHRPWSVG